MKQISSKQRRTNSELAKIKKTLGTRCAICGREGHDLSHILPRSLYPEYQTDPRNLQILCRECHSQTDIVERALLIDELSTNRYFGL